MTTKMNMLGITLSLVILGSAVGLDAGSDIQKKPVVASSLSNRAARLFFVSTTTSTLSTTTVCFYSHTSAVTTTCSGKKKRAIFTNPETGEDSHLEIAPKRVERELKIDEEPREEGTAEKAADVSVDEIASGQNEDTQNIRDAKFLLYWATSTSTTTTYTATSTIATVNCTPASFTISVCG